MYSIALPEMKNVGRTGDAAERGLNTRHLVLSALNQMACSFAYSSHTFSITRIALAVGASKVRSSA